MAAAALPTVARADAAVLDEDRFHGELRENTTPRSSTVQSDHDTSAGRLRWRALTGRLTVHLLLFLLREKESSAQHVVAWEQLKTVYGRTQGDAFSGILCSVKPGINFKPVSE